MARQAWMLVLPLAVASCGEGDRWPPPPDGLGACNTATCQGCCQGGTCLPGHTDEACGAFAFPCQACAGDQTCSAGSCVPLSKTCNSSTCPKGCCKGDKCTPGLTPTACGVLGKPCLVCKEMEVCSQGKCVAYGKCNPTNCKTCCRAGVCVPGNTDAACGNGGAECMDCTVLSGKCSAGICSNCTPSCQGKCYGAPNGCGGTCTTNTCAGCCQGAVCQPGTANTVCGKSGKQCADCVKAGGTCQGDGSCSFCTPSCQGKCPGAPDGCGKTCTTSSCTGCCNGTKCEPGTNDNACGKAGGACSDCTLTPGGTCKPDGSCSTCSPNCTNQCSGASDGCGGTCGGGSCSGCCLGTACNPGTADNACGTGGGTCTVCASPKSCVSGSCALDQSSQWAITIVSATISSTTPAGIWWDVGIGSAVDPDVWANVTTAGSTKATTVQYNTCTPYWGEYLYTKSAGTLLGSTVNVSLYDQDVSYDDPIGDCFVPVTEGDLIAGTKSVYDCDIKKSVKQLNLKFDKQ